MSENIIGQSDLIRALGLLRDAEMIVFKYQEQNKGKNECDHGDVLDVENGVCEAAFAISKLVGHDILVKSFYEKDK